MQGSCCEKLCKGAVLVNVVSSFFFKIVVTMIRTAAHAGFAADSHVVRVEAPLPEHRVTRGQQMRLHRVSH